MGCLSSHVAYFLFSKTKNLIQLVDHTYSSYWEALEAAKEPNVKILSETINLNIFQWATY